jgi:hypothetical protein
MKKKKEVRKMPIERTIPDINHWYTHGTGVDVIAYRLVNEYEFTEKEAAELIEEIIYV